MNRFRPGTSACRHVNPGASGALVRVDRAVAIAALTALLLLALLAGPGAAQTVTLISSDPDLVDVGAIATDGANLYVGGASGGVARVWQIPIGGGPATRLYAAPWTPTGGCCVVSIAVLGNDVFWIDPNS